MTPGQTTSECGVISNDTVAYSGIELLGWVGRANSEALG
jgi:hypothetical protein